jgi:methylphosphotriester-DNA--protein-cysteine methyltransferase
MKKIRILIPIILLEAFTVVCLSLGVDYKFVGSVKSNKYHYPTCRWALKIKSENLVTFESAKEALEAEYIPCKVCKPPAKD